METFRVLSTKKLLANQKQFLLNAGLSVVEADFISVNLKRFEIGIAKDNLIFTSQNAVISFLHNGESAQLKDKGIFCVGIKTKAALEHYGYTVKVCTDYAEELAKTITQGYADKSFTFFSGNLRRDTLPEALKAAGIEMNEIQAYETVLSPHTIKSKLNGILFYSPSGVESYLKENNITNETCFCIGTTTANALKDITQNVVIANQPSVENVIIQCINYYKERI
ncbi:uroporphyrinogen-III synthase [Flavobacterium suzhouense]|uniref:Uroporphyrinogen-III synthase n=1 Tax=Flavobacterium suzhouense TaxID=1529638 RepID=A0ABW5NWH7_9FLAO